MKAAEEDHTNIAMLLLNANADITNENKNGRTALSFAAAPRRDGSQWREAACATLCLLLERCADINHKDFKHCTARDRAASEHRDDALRIFGVWQRMPRALEQGDVQPTRDRYDADQS